MGLFFAVMKIPIKIFWQNLIVINFLRHVPETANSRCGILHDTSVFTKTRKYKQNIAGHLKLCYSLENKKVDTSDSFCIICNKEFTENMPEGLAVR